MTLGLTKQTSSLAGLSYAAMLNYNGPRSPVIRNRTERALESRKHECTRQTMARPWPQRPGRVLLLRLDADENKGQSSLADTDSVARNASYKEKRG